MGSNPTHATLFFNMLLDKIITFCAFHFTGSQAQEKEKRAKNNLSISESFVHYTLYNNPLPIIDLYIDFTFI